MRIISGKYKGRKLKGFDIEGTRPTMDRVKESLFAMIQTKINDAKVLDLFAGSGALGLEALSNGAQKVYLIDKNEEAIKALKYNSQNMENVHILKVDYKKYLKETNETFDIIFLDPPYKDNLMNKSLKIINERNLLNEGGIIICEYEEGYLETNLTIWKERKYGSKNIKILIK